MRKDMWKRIAAALLCLAMLAGCLAFAEDGEVTGEPVESTATVVEGSVTGADDANMGAAGEVPQEGAVDAADDEDALPLADGASDGGDVEQTGEDVEQTGEDVEQTGDNVDQTGEDVDQSDDVYAEVVEDEETGDDLIAGAQRVATFASLDEDSGIMLMAAAPEKCAGGHDFVDIEPISNEVGVASLGESGHKVTYEVITGKQCTRCGLYDPDTYKVTQETGEVEPHDYTTTPGVCSMCGYECKHPHATVTEGDWIGEVLYYTYISEEQHLYSRWKEMYFTCECGVRYTSDSPASKQLAELENHTFDDETGKCVCGYQKPAAGHVHNWVIDYDVEVPGGPGIYDSVEPSAEGCIVKGLHRDCYAYCEGCGNKYTYDYDPNDTVVLAHDFVSGTCSRCGYTLDCKHERKHIREVKQEDTLLSGTLRPNGNGTHSGKFVQQTDWFCRDCFYEGTTTEVVEGVQKCVYRESDDTCVCGAKKNDCKHTTTGGVIEQFRATGGGAVDLGNGKHSCAGMLRTFKICSICGEHYDETEKEVEEYHEPHLIDAETGKCACGYETPSDHKHTIAWRPIKAEALRVDRKDQNTHYATYPVRYYCTTCSMNFTIVDETAPDGSGDDPHYRTIEEPHEWLENGVCRLCGAVRACTHEGLHDTTPVVKKTYKDIPDNEKEHQVVEESTYTCPTCLVSFTETSAPKLEPHDYKEVGDGIAKCAAEGCGHVCKHLHVGEPDLDLGQILERYEQKDDAVHLVIRRLWGYCDDCGKQAPTEKTISQPEPHNYVDGVCTTKYGDQVCGHVCKHSQVDETCEEGGEWLVGFKENDDATHLVVRQPMRWCPCGVEAPFGDTFTEPEPHNYVDGVCTTKDGDQVCGHVCAHSNKILDTDHATRVENDKPVSDNDDTHSTGYTLTTPWTCPDCKKSGTEVTQHPTGEPVKHSYEKVGDDYVCSVCGHVCAHTGVTPAVREEVSYPEAGIGQLGHTPKTTTTTTLDCPHGHEKIVKTETVDGVNEGHSYVGGVCQVCGFKCAHPNTVQEEEPRNIRYTSNGAAGHTVTYDMCNVERCYYCKVEIGEPEVINAGLTVTEEHSFSGDRCTLCGYARPAATPRPTATPAPSEQPVVTDEPAFQEVAPEVPVHGVTADSSTRMATALSEAIEGIQSDYGTSATIEIRDAEKVFSTQESATLTKLPVQEQMLVLLMVLGYEDEVYTGMNEAGITLSQEAEDLIRDVTERITTMSEAEFAEFMEMVGQIFPVIQSADGQHTEITLEIRGTDGSVRYERYGFDFVDGAWVFSKLEVAEDASADEAA